MANHCALRGMWWNWLNLGVGTRLLGSLGLNFNGI